IICEAFYWRATQMNEVDQLMPWRHMLRNFVRMSPTTAWRREKTDPEFAALKIEMGPGRFGARLSDVQRYIANRPAAKPVPAPAKALAARAARKPGPDDGRAPKRKAARIAARSGLSSSNRPEL